jgi:4-diphosphocytidyl-2-C-methyl-D-erythritol kinase
MYLQYTPSKLNLTLRVVGTRSDGYHNICSLFYRNDATEQLTICVKKANNVSDSVTTEPFPIPGENIISRCMRVLRRTESFANLPFLDIGIHKTIPPGTGIGAGSGNAAAFLRWAVRFAGAVLPDGVCESIGADVPFLFEGSKLALVGDIGIVCERLSLDRGFNVILVVPDWFSNTRRAFSKLDSFFKGAFPLDEPGARAEAFDVIRALSAGRRVGLLPNDFSGVLFREHPEYELLAALGHSSGAPGYGLSGSGSAFFFLADNDTSIAQIMHALNSLPWCRRIITMG